MSTEASRRLSMAAMELGLPARYAVIATHLYDEAVKYTSYRMDMKKTLAACILTVALHHGEFRTYEETLAVLGVTQKLGFMKAFTFIKHIYGRYVPRTTMEDLASRYADNLRLSQAVKDVAINIAGILDQGRANVPRAAVAVFLASQSSAEQRTIEQLVAVVHRTKETILPVYRTILGDTANLFPPGYISQLPN